MTKITMLTIGLAGSLVTLAAACSTASNTATTASANQQKTAASPTAANTVGNTATASSPGDESAPDSVKAAIPEAQTFNKQHKNMTPGQLAEVEKTAGVKPPDTDHHYFAAYSSAGGARKQIAAATTLKADGKDIIVIYENREGKPFIKEVRADGVPAAFLSQFVGKSHDDKMQLGTDLKANGVDEKTAKAMADAIRVDAVTMQILYGAKDTH